MTTPQKHKAHNPDHYRGAVINGKPVQVVDIMEAYFLHDAHLSQACKYMLRAGKKRGQSYLKDVGKALWWLARAIWFRDGTVVLPPKVEVFQPDE